MKTRVVGEETFTIKPLCSQRKYNWNPRGQISGKFIVQNKGREFVHATTGTRKTCVFHDLFLSQKSLGQIVHTPGVCVLFMSMIQIQKLFENIFMLRNH